MGLGGISIWQLLIILVIVLLLFGTKRLKTLGSDLGGAIKGFKKAVGDENHEGKDGVVEDPKRVPEENKVKAESETSKSDSKQI